MKLTTYSEAIDSFPGQLLLLPIFKEDRPLPDGAGLVDWRLNGFISRQLLNRQFLAEAGETLLMTSSGRLPCSKILLYGLGRAKLLKKERLNKLFAELFLQVQKMDIAECGLALSKNKILPQKIEEMAKVVNAAAELMSNKLAGDWFEKLSLHLLFAETVHWTGKIVFAEESAEVGRIGQ